MNELKLVTTLALAIVLSLSLITALLYSGTQIVYAQSTNTDNNNNNITNNNAKTNFLIFRNSTLGVHISYPNYWQESQAGNILSFTSPLQTVGVKLVIIPNVNMSLDEFTAKRILAL